MSLPEAKLLLKEDDELIKEVFDYWSRKRKNSKANSLIPNVKQEKRDGSSTSDPYVAFRRRTEKMQTRKVGRLSPGVWCVWAVGSLYVGAIAEVVNFQIRVCAGVGCTSGAYYVAVVQRLVFI